MAFSDPNAKNRMEIWETIKNLGRHAKCINGVDPFSEESWNVFFWERDYIWPMLHRFPTSRPCEFLLSVGGSNEGQVVGFGPVGSSCVNLVKNV